MSYSAHEQELYDHAKSALPRFLFSKKDGAEDWIGGFVKVFDAARTQLDTWIGYMLILSASGIWLDQHARDRGLSRKLGETDGGLRTRIRAFADTVIPAAIISAATAILTAAGVTIPDGYPGLVEMKRDRGYMGTWDASPDPTPPHEAASRQMTYLSRGYRMSRISSIVVILPYGTNESVRVTAYETINKIKAAGFPLRVERRENP